MNRPVFQPKYGGPYLWWYAARFLLVGVPAALLALLRDDAAAKGIAFTILAVVLVYFVLTYIRQIEFGGKSLLIVRFLLPPKAIKYSDVFELGEDEVVILHWGNLYLQSMLNKDELLRLLRAFVPNPGERSKAERNEYRKSYYWNVARFIAVFLLILCGLLFVPVLLSTPR